MPPLFLICSCFGILNATRSSQDDKIARGNCYSRMEHYIRKGTNKDDMAGLNCALRRTNPPTPGLGAALQLCT
jgi:hypothetical protein